MRKKTVGSRSLVNELGDLGKESEIPEQQMIARKTGTKLYDVL